MSMQIQSGNSQSAGHGKLILFGEHAAVYGHPAVGLPLPMRTTITRSQCLPLTASAVQRHSRFPQIIAATKDDEQTIYTLLENLSRMQTLQSGRKIRPHLNREKWQITNGVPRCGGFGSSAAICTAMARMLTGHNDERYSTRVHRLAHQLERYFHGTPSGIDTGMASDTEPAAWLPKQNLQDIPRRIPLKIPEWYLSYGALPRSAETAATIRQLKTAMEAGEKQTVRDMEVLGEISRDFIRLTGQYESAGHPESGDALPKNSQAAKPAFPRAAARLCARAQSILSRLKLSPPPMDRIFLLAQQCGALAGKISGGGMGGAFWLCAESKESRDNMNLTLSQMLREQNIQLAWPLTPLDIKRPYIIDSGLPE